jgi:3-methyladenine DNA glycosylase/8-oxoguanine DNA glycosylase
MQLYLSARPPFSFAAVADSHGWRQLAPFSGDRDALGYILRLAAGRVVELRLTGAGDGVCVNTEDGLEPAEKAEVTATVAWMLGLEQDLAPFYQVARHEPKLAAAAAEAKGRILRSATLFEDVVKTILTTNTAGSSTRRMAANLVNLFGAPLPAAPDRRAFPTPEGGAGNPGIRRSIHRIAIQFWVARPVAEE